MPVGDVVISLPIADRRASYAFFRDVLGLEAFGEPAADGVPEPLQFRLAAGTVLMLVPSGGFGWVVDPHQVAERGHSECVLGVSAADAAGVDELVARAESAGARVLSPPGQKPWGYVGTFADLDGHVWMVTAEA